MALGLLLAATASWACAGRPPADAPPNAAPGLAPTSSAARPPAATPTPHGSFEVHEWGVIDVAAGGAIEVGAGPGAPSEDPPRPVKKPVLYFHLDEGAPPTEITVSARIPSGRMLEVWPSGQLRDDAVRWPNVLLGPCPSPYPSFSARSGELAPPGYPTRDGFNEVRELGGYETTDAACVTSGGVLGRLLFYRGAVRGTRLPIELVPDPDGGIALRASVAGSGNVFFVAGGGRGMSLPWPSVDRPRPLPASLVESLDGVAMTRQLERAIVERGLTAAEAKAFLRAWSQPFFGVRTAAGDQPRAPVATCAPRPDGPPASIIYLMPDASVASVAELTIEPKPRHVKRVLVVRIELP